VTAGEALLAGANGIVPVCANYDPNIFLRLYQAGTRGDGTEVAQVMRRVALLRDNLVLSGPCWLSGIKYAVAALGIGTGRPISPLEPVDPTRKARIDDVFLEDQVAQGQD
jgi:dihydrodipicolinate synthase/N-acetylneuraminate lyase